MLWFTGNHEAPIATEPETSSAEAASAVSAPEPELTRGVPRNGTLDPISIDPSRPADVLPQYQADTILDDYKQSEAGADERYRGVYLIVEGVASGIRRGDGNQVFLDIRTDDPTRVVRANLLQQQICGPAGRTCEVEARATMVRRGQKVAVECTGGGQADGTPVLNDCLLRGGAN
jgi:hypothetical protein